MMWVLLVLGLVLLVVGAEWLVRGASRFAAAVGISPLVIGLTVVAYGTSMPEMAVSVLSGMAGHADVSLGNVVGSNIFNVLFILGASACIVPLGISLQLIRLDVPLMIGVSILAWILGSDGVIGRLDGLLLFLGILVYTLFLLISSRGQNHAAQQPFVAEYSLKNKGSLADRLWDLGLIAAGLVLLVLGSQWLVTGSVSIAESWGVSQLVIGLTIVAAGTSLPELATSFVASLRGERDIAVGNVVGSNIFNILGVLGVSAMVSPQGIVVSDAAWRLDLPVMIAVAVVCFPIFFTGRVIARWEGVLFLGFYVSYTIQMLLATIDSPATFYFRLALVGLAAPLAVVAIIVSTLRGATGRSPC